MDILVLGIMGGIILLIVKRLMKKESGCHTSCSGCDKDCKNCHTDLLKEYRQNEK